MIPANTIAETVQRLKGENVYFLSQIEKNSELIEKLEPLAEWTEAPSEIDPNA
jgi:hypothetical protein